MLYTSDKEYEDALLEDKDSRWQELIENNHWNPASETFCFLDPISFRYYLPAAMIRTIRAKADQGILFHLTLPALGEGHASFTLERWSWLNETQKTAVGLFLIHMRHICEDASQKASFQKALDCYWNYGRPVFPRTDQTEVTEAWRKSIIAQIHRAFSEDLVDRTGDVSWSQTRILDLYGSEEELAEAGLKDTDRHWTELLQNPDWNPDWGVGGWGYLGPKSFQYYLPAGMIRTLESGEDEGILRHLKADADADQRWKDFRRAKWTQLTDYQEVTIGLFLRFMSETYDGECDYGEYNLQWDDAIGRPFR